MIAVFDLSQFFVVCLFALFCFVFPLVKFFIFFTFFRSWRLINAAKNVVKSISRAAWYEVFKCGNMTVQCRKPSSSVDRVVFFVFT